jgi:hypothetical protein
MAKAHLGKRREPRFPLAFEIEVSGIDKDEQAFHVRTVTSTVSNFGCSFELPFGLDVDSIVMVRVLPTENGASEGTEPAMFQIVRSSKHQRRWNLGAWKMGLEHVWPVELPKERADRAKEEADQKKEERFRVLRRERS